jgi:hypothetical protein
MLASFDFMLARMETASFNHQFPIAVTQHAQCTCAISAIATVSAHTGGYTDGTRWA